MNRGPSKSADNTISFVLEWENANRLEAEEALGFLHDLIDRIGSYSLRHPNRRTRIAVLFDHDVSGEMVERIAGKCRNQFEPEDIVLLTCKGVPYYSMKMVAAYHTDSEILVYCDSDCIYVDDWIELITQPLLAGAAELVYGTSYASIGQTWKERASALSWFFAVDGLNDPTWPRCPGGSGESISQTI